MTTLFITGSGTDIGKTFLACRLLEALPAALAVRCLKPIVSGYEPAAAAASDPGRLLAARGLAVDAATIDAISPWRFRAPLSVDMAAAREGRAIPFDELVAFCRPRAGVDLTLIEGVGGVMAPLGERHSVLDWIAALDAPVLLVVGSYLGSLSHSLTAARALEAMDIDVAAVVVSQSVDEPVAASETMATLARFLGPTPLLALPRGATRAGDELLALVLARLERA